MTDSTVQPTAGSAQPPAGSAQPSPAPLIRRGREVRFRGDDEFHQCWYPVALSAEVPVGAIVGAPFLDGKVVVYRTSDGQVHVHSAYCRHLGADLSGGTLVNDRLQCPFHYWRYDGRGACAEIPAGDRPPAAAKLYDYPVAESLGLIWAFNGETPLHEPPHFDYDESEIEVVAYRNPHVMQVDSSVAFLNVFDLQHFRVVHGMAIDVDTTQFLQQDHTLAYDARIATPEFGEIVQRRKLWGVNTLTVDSASGGRPVFMMHALCPVGPDTTQGFLVNGTTKAPPGDAQLQEQVRQMLQTAREYSLRLVGEDAPIFKGLRFRHDCLTASDKLLAFGINYVLRYPRAHPGRALIG